jgi:hypothetical protein
VIDCGYEVFFLPAPSKDSIHKSLRGRQMQGFLRDWGCTRHLYRRAVGVFHARANYPTKKNRRAIKKSSVISDYSSPFFSSIILYYGQKGTPSRKSQAKKGILLFENLVVDRPTRPFSQQNAL